MQVAIDKLDSGFGKAYGPGVVLRIVAQIEGFRLRERKHVVVEGIAVREVDNRAGRDREQVRDERLVALIHHGAPRVGPFERAALRGFEIDDRSQAVRQIALTRRS